MGEWKKSSCVLCAQNCGLEFWVEDNAIQRVRGDKDNLRSQGYCCSKGMKLAYYEHHADRLLYPLKKTGNTHERISWEQAIREISEQALKIKGKYGPKSFAYMGGGSTGGQMEVGVGLRLLRALGSAYYYSSMLQEFSNSYWVEGRLAGRQGVISTPDVHHAETVVAWGWNGWMSHQEPRTRELINEIKNDPQRRLIVIDPRLSETAQRADIHLAVRPGADTMLLKAMIKIILDNGWENQEFLAGHVRGWEEVITWFDGFDARRAIEEVCGLNYETILETARLIACTKSVIHQDLGIYMNRNSTINCYMLHILRCLSGNFGTEGGQIYPAILYPMGGHSDERDPKTLRTVKNNMFPIMKAFPPAIFPEEVLNDHPERIRAVFVSSANPLRSFPDTKAYEEAFKAMELSVCIDVAYTETAQACDYVLPSLSYLESYDTTCFNYSYPDLFFQLRQPAVKPVSEECREGSAIMIGLAKEMGFLPELPEALYQAACKGITFYLGALERFMKENPQYVSMLPLILGETLGKGLGSVNQALVVGLLVNSSKGFKAGAVAMGYPADFTMIEAMYKDILAHPQGLILAKFPGSNFNLLRTEDKKIALLIEELEDPIKAATIEHELAALELPDEFPMILHSGLHIETVMNTILRNPEWKKGKEEPMLMHAEDAGRLGLSDGALAMVKTEAGEVRINVKISPHAASGCVYIPHGGGLIYQGEKFGVNVNELVKSTQRDSLCTPMHRRIPCKVEKV